MWNLCAFLYVNVFCGPKKALLAIHCSYLWREIHVFFVRIGGTCRFYLNLEFSFLGVLFNSGYPHVHQSRHSPFGGTSRTLGFPTTILGLVFGDGKLRSPLRILYASKLHASRVGNWRVRTIEPHDRSVPSFFTICT